MKSILLGIPKEKDTHRKGSNIYMTKDLKGKIIIKTIIIIINTIIIIIVIKTQNYIIINLTIIIKIIVE